MAGFRVAAATAPSPRRHEAPREDAGVARRRRSSTRPLGHSRDRAPAGRKGSWGTPGRRVCRRGSGVRSARLMGHAPARSGRGGRVARVRDDQDSQRGGDATARSIAGRPRDQCGRSLRSDSSSGPPPISSQPAMYQHPARQSFSSGAGADRRAQRRLETSSWRNRVADQTVYCTSAPRRSPSRLTRPRGCSGCAGPQPSCRTRATGSRAS